LTPTPHDEETSIMTSSTKSAWARTGVITVTLLTATYAWTQHARRDAAATHIVEQRSSSPVSLRNPLAESTNRQADVGRSLADVNAKVAALTAQLERLQTQAPGQTASASSRSSSGSFVEELQQANEQAEAQANAQQAFVEQAIVGEKLDPSWAPSAEASLRSMFEDNEIHSLKLLNAQCRATLCRMEIAPSVEGGPDDFELSFRRMLLHMPWQGQGFGRVFNPFGQSPTAVFFLAREGKPLPQAT
jgi:hypothetical protein